jgi:hypothetical protein
MYKKLVVSCAHKSSSYVILHLQYFIYNKTINKQLKFVVIVFVHQRTFLFQFYSGYPNVRLIQSQKYTTVVHHRVMAYNLTIYSFVQENNFKIIIYYIKKQYIVYLFIIKTDIYKVNSPANKWIDYILINILNTLIKIFETNTLTVHK